MLANLGFLSKDLLVVFFGGVVFLFLLWRPHYAYEVFLCSFSSERGSSFSGKEKLAFSEEIKKPVDISISENPGNVTIGSQQEA